MASHTDIWVAWRLAKRQVETALRIFGPENITSSLDFDTFSDKLDHINTKWEIFRDKSKELIDTLEDSTDKRTEAGKVIFDMDIMIKKKNKNENDVKQKIKQIMKELKDGKNGMVMKEETILSGMVNKSARSKLSDSIAEYCATGPFLLHLPQYIATMNFTLKHYRENLPTIG